MLVYIFILCMYLILSILIAMGEGIQFPKAESEIRFGWGLLLYNCYVQFLVKIGKHHLTFSKRLGHQFISLKKFI